MGATSGSDVENKGKDGGNARQEHRIRTDRAWIVEIYKWKLMTHKPVIVNVARAL